MPKQKKQLVVLLAVLLVLGISYACIHIYNQKQKEKEEDETESIAVTELDASQVTQFSYIQDGVTLSFTKNGTKWQYDADGGIDIDEDGIETMIEKASGIIATDEITEYDDLTQYGLEEPSNVITMTRAEGITTLYIGTQNEMTSEYYVKTGDSDSVYVVDGTTVSGFDKTVEELTAAEETEATENIESTEE